jgi:hypothetical protein
VATPRESLPVVNYEVICVNKKLYCVSWTQGHRAKVRARNAEDAKTIATWLDDRYTLECLRNLSVREVRG